MTAHFRNLRGRVIPRLATAQLLGSALPDQLDYFLTARSLLEKSFTAECDGLRRISRPSCLIQSFLSKIRARARSSAPCGDFVQKPFAVTGAHPREKNRA